MKKLTLHLAVLASATLLATAALAGYMVNANSVGKASFTGKYGRKK